jgi:hypothetical protein
MQKGVKFMKRLFQLALFAILLLGVSRHNHVAQADTGPKPTMDFDFEFESGVEDSAIVSGILFECNAQDCSDAAPLQEVGPQALYCEPESCRAIGYGFAPYTLLEIEFSDGVTRRSNIFEPIDFDSYYTVYVRPEDLRVEPRFSAEAIPTWAMILIACICALIGIGLVVGLVVVLRRRARA